MWKEKKSQQAGLGRNKAKQDLCAASFITQKNVFTSEAYVLQTCQYDLYDIFSVEPLHTFQFGISKLL